MRIIKYKKGGVALVLCCCIGAASKIDCCCLFFIISPTSSCSFHWFPFHTGWLLLFVFIVGIFTSHSAGSGIHCSSGGSGHRDHSADKCASKIFKKYSHIFILSFPRWWRGECRLLFIYFPLSSSICALFPHAGWLLIGTQEVSGRGASKCASNIFNKNIIFSRDRSAGKCASKMI